MSMHDPRYLRFFECFNEQLFFEAHEVLEGLWLPQRQGPNGAFYKGLIQLAGAFVHMQKNRLGPAAVLLGLARENLRKYPVTHEALAVTAVLALIEDWLHRLTPANPMRNPFTPDAAPRLYLQGREGRRRVGVPPGYRRVPGGRRRSSSLRRERS